MTEASRKRRHKDEPEIQLQFGESPQPMLVVDPRTLEFLGVNQAAINRYGHSRSEFRSMRLTDLVPPEDRARVKDLFKKDLPELPGFCQTRFVLKNGQSADIDMRVYNVRWDGEDAVLVVPQDGTPHKRLEDQLQQAQKMEAVGMLAGGIAHDFNNLLTIINGYSQMLLGGLSEDDENRSSVEQIMKAGERAAELTRQLLTFSRRQAVRPKALDLNTVIASTAVMLRRLIGEHIELRIVEGPGLAKVHADSGQLEQVILNLAVNSRDAMPTGGTLILETQNVDLEEPYTGPHTTLDPGRYAMLAVTDTGVGMDAQTRLHLFEPFFTTKEQGRGTGLGLSTVYSIVKQSRGEIVVYSEPGHGTCVKVYFPSVTEAATEDPSEEATEKTRPGSETILLVEDEEAVRKLVRRTLERQGYHLLVAASGADAVRIAEQHSGPIHLLITDVVMPQMSGRETAERLKALRSGLHVLFVSGYTETTFARTGGLAAGELFLQKPFTPLALVRRVRELLDRANGQPHPPKTEGGNH
ncbi:MAG TPA: response regulator [Bryobacteraceae bacterium]|nr:response regulator [Bryobacteraceae bacterium]